MDNINEQINNHNADKLGYKISASISTAGTVVSVASLVNFCLNKGDLFLFQTLTTGTLSALCTLETGCLLNDLKHTKEELQELYRQKELSKKIDNKQFKMINI